MKYALSLTALALLGSKVDAFWRMQCGVPVIVDRVDPIVFPGKIDGHIHNVMGGSAFDKTISTKQLQGSKCTSCQVDDDMSNYWVPTLYFKGADGSFKAVRQKDGMLVYYLPERGRKYGKVEPFPDNFGMIAGDPKLRTYDESQPKTSEARMRQDAIGFTCLNYGGATEGFAEHRGFPEREKLDTCVDGLRADINFPSCWNGELDSPNHRDHMAYPDGLEDGKCPDTHKRRLTTLKFEVSFMVAEFKGQAGEFVWSTGDSTGYSYHGDFYNGWKGNLLSKAMNDKTCAPDDVSATGGVIEDCPVFKGHLQTPEKQAQCKAKAISGTDWSTSTSTIPGMTLSDSKVSAAGAAPAGKKKGKGKGKGKKPKTPAQPANEQEPKNQPAVLAKQVKQVEVTVTETITSYVPAATEEAYVTVGPRVRRHFRFHRRSN